MIGIAIVTVITASSVFWWWIGQAWKEGGGYGRCVDFNLSFPLWTRRMLCLTGRLYDPCIIFLELINSSSHWRESLFLYSGKHELWKLHRSGCTGTADFLSWHHDWESTQEILLYISFCQSSHSGEGYAHSNCLGMMSSSDLYVYS